MTVDRPRAARIEGFRTRLKRALSYSARYCSQIGEASTIRERGNAGRMSHLRVCKLRLWVTARRGSSR